MKLIADAGSTKVEWALVGPDGAVHTFESPGVNALMLSDEELRRAYSSALRGIDGARVSETFYYGAGCVSRSVCEKVAAGLPVKGNVKVGSDLLGAARALYGTDSGLAGIIGTGSNTGLYDGNTIGENMPPLGFILGDEGSGAAMGRELLIQVYRFNVMRTTFESWLGMGYAEVLERVYRRPGANAFLASLVPFVACRRDECAQIIERTFTPLMRQISGYYGAKARELRLTGGVAEAFKEELRAIGAAHGVEVTRVKRRPMEGLIEYHQHS